MPFGEEFLPGDIYMGILSGPYISKASKLSYLDNPAWKSKQSHDAQNQYPYLVPYFQICLWHLTNRSYYMSIPVKKANQTSHLVKVAYSGTLAWEKSLLKEMPNSKISSIGNSTQEIPSEDCHLLSFGGWDVLSRKVHKGIN